MSAELDKAIDRAVREMLGVEPRADLQRRVMDRIEGRAASTFRPAHVASAFPPAHVASAFRRTLWISAPLAAAAVLVLAVWGPWRQARVSPVPVTPASIAVVQPAQPPVVPAPHPSGVSAPAPTIPDRVTAPRIARAAPPRNVIVAAVAEDAPPVEGFPRVPALSVPELVVPAVRTVGSVAGPSELGVEPIAAPAPIEIEPLPMSPRERQEQE
jgi:hypothetical protein